MKRMLIPMLTLLTALLLSLSASAAAEYGVIYTEADCLYSDELAVLGSDHLPWFTETYGIDLRVDVLKSIGDFDTLEDAAIAIYEEYAYGYGEGRNGVTLTLLIHEDEDGVALDDWYVYAAGDSDELTTNGAWNVYPALNEIMTEELWSGDAAQDTKTLEAAVVGTRDALEEFVLAGGVAGSIWSPVSSALLPAEIPADVPDRFPASGETIGYVTDTAGILTPKERQLLTETAQAVSATHDFGVYIITVENFEAVTGCSDVFDGATALYRTYDLGAGSKHKGVLLLLSMSGRDYSLISYSDYGNFVFDEETREEMTYYFLDDFRYDDWYTGFADYLNACDAMLQGGAGKVSSAVGVKVGIILLLPLVIAAIVILILSLKMRSVAKATQAEVYAGDGLELTASYDHFTHATEVRHKRQTQSSGGGGGGRSRSSGGFGGTSGKF